MTPPTKLAAKQARAVRDRRTVAGRRFGRLGLSSRSGLPGSRPLPGFRGPVEVDDAALGERPADLKRCCPEPVAPFAPVPEALLQRGRNRLGGWPVAHRVLGSELKRHRRADLQIP